MNKRVVAVNFRTSSSDEVYGGKDYHFYSLDDVHTGDKVVVETVNGLTIGRVSRLLPDNESKYANKWIVQKIDTKAYSERVEKEEKLADLKAQLSYKLSLDSEREYYKELQNYSGSEDVRILAEEISKMTEMW